MATFTIESQETAKMDGRQGTLYHITLQPEVDGNKWNEQQVYFVVDGQDYKSVLQTAADTHAAGCVKLKEEEDKNKLI